jgi:hypothetical protein
VTITETLNFLRKDLSRAKDDLELKMFGNIDTNYELVRTIIMSGLGLLFVNAFLYDSIDIIHVHLSSFHLS